jgi:putative ABC transport system substrate-binding protein
MKRRNVIGIIAALGAVPRAFAQPRKPARPFRIGVLTRLSPQARERFAARFGRYGWTDGRDYSLVDLDADATHRFDDEARSILAKNVDLLIVFSTAGAVAAHRQTKSTSIVMMFSGYPVEAGVADSLARPGRNVTGNSIYAGMGIWGKLVELLRDAKPGIRRVGVLCDYVPPAYPKEEIEPLAREYAEAERRLGIRIHRVDIERADLLEDALKSIGAANPDALVLTSGPALWPTRQRILQFSEERRLPTVADFQLPEDKGLRPLLTYSPVLDDLRAAAIEYVVRILGDGAKPGELPIRLPARFELVVNLKAASAIGLTVPQVLLMRADRVIE